MSSSSNLPPGTEQGGKVVYVGPTVKDGAFTRETGDVGVLLSSGAKNGTVMVSLPPLGGKGESRRLFLPVDLLSSEEDAQERIRVANEERVDTALERSRLVSKQVKREADAAFRDIKGRLVQLSVEIDALHDTVVKLNAALSEVVDSVEQRWP